ncbi:MAG: hypothetical protein ACRD0J_00700, partial [Acidimicrobiales bacterium]
ELGLGPSGPGASEEEMEHLAGLLVGHGPVLELGSGQGRLLLALAGWGTEARGAEADAEELQASRRCGVEAVGGDPLVILGATADRALGGLVALDLIEGLGPQELLDLVRTAADKVRPGGRVVLGASNPRSLLGLAGGAGARPDRLPVDPGWLARCCEEAGFAQVAVEWCGTGAGGGRGQVQVGEEAEVHRLLFGATSYVVVADR